MWGNFCRQGREKYPATTQTTPHSSAFQTAQPAMAAPKRKENPNTRAHAGSTAKKLKKETSPAKVSKRVQDLETATDSDPLVESDTTSQSGDDDGVSWPSDEEKNLGEDWEGLEGAEDNDNGGVKITAKAADASQSAKTGPNDANEHVSGMSEQSTFAKRS